MNQQEICPNIWHGEEDYRVYCTLVQGTRRSILWDTGQGKQDLNQWVRAHGGGTEVLVLNSHGHTDHIGGNHRFSAVRANRADWPLIQAHARLTGGGLPAFCLEDLEPGQTFDLGGYHVRVVSMAGHTRGSVGLLVVEARLLLAGDGLNATLLLLGEESASFAVLQRTLSAVKTLPFDRYLTSHAPCPLGREQVEVHLRHLKHLRRECPTLSGGPYGPDVCRSVWKEPAGRSVFYFERRRWTEWRQGETE